MPDHNGGTGGSSIGKDDRHGPLPVLLFVLTAVTGLVDAVSYLQVVCSWRT
jgi:hypothetical protein